MRRGIADSSISSSPPSPLLDDSTSPLLLSDSEQESMILHLRTRIHADEIQYRSIFNVLVFIALFVNVFGFFIFLSTPSRWYSWLNATGRSDLISSISVILYYSLSFASFFFSSSVVGSPRIDSTISISRHITNCRIMWLTSFLSLLICYVFIVLPLSPRVTPFQMLDTENISNVAAILLLGSESIYLFYMSFCNVVVAFVSRQVDSMCNDSWNEVEKLEQQKYKHEKI